MLRDLGNFCNLQPSCADRWATLLRRTISFSQGPKCKTLISEYIKDIPLSGNPFLAAKQSMSGMPPPWIPVSNAMIAKVGAAASDSRPSALALSRSRNGAASESITSDARCAFIHPSCETI